MKKLKIIFYASLTIFLLYTIYLVVIVFVLNIVSLHSNHIIHSDTIEESKNKNYYVSSYNLDKAISTYNLPDSLVPKNIFIEKEMMGYELYYFYWGKIVRGTRTTMTGDIFSSLSKSGEYLIVCPTSTLPDEEGSISIYSKGMYFFFDTIPFQIKFLIRNREEKNYSDTLIYKKV